MSHRALQKRTFGIVNDDWLLLSFAVSFVILVMQGLLLLIEGILMIFNLIPSSTSKDIFVIFVTTSHFGGFLGILIVVVLSVVKSEMVDLPQMVWKSQMEWKYHKLAFRKMASFTVFTVIYLYNPWIVAYQVEAVGFYDIFKWTTFVFNLFAPTFLVTCLFLTFILWKMRRIEADYEPCEVIYGAEDSETKKLMEYYE